jgi:predicted acyl esterase
MRFARPAAALALLVAVGSLLVPTATVHAQQATPCDSSPDDPTDYSHVSQPGPYEPLAPEIVELDSEVDGATIQMGLIRPAVPEGTRVPVIVHASVYYHALQTMNLVDCDGFLINNYVPHGYAVVLLAVRGTADSGGCMNLMGPEERADIDQAITWLGEQPWSSGSVGMWGKSYDGSTPWMAASFGNPHLKTIVPASGVPDLFALMYGAGTPDWRGPAILSDIYYAQSAFFYAPGRSPQHTAEVLACPEYGTGTTASLYSGATGLMDPLGYWAERRYTDDVLRNYRGSVFLVQGMQDWNVNPGQQFPWIGELEERGVPVKYMLGQWGHSWPDEVSPPHVRLDFADILLRWWDRWLKGRRGSTGPTAQVEDNTGVWRNSSAWPPTNGETETLWLDPARALSTTSSDQTGTEVIGPDPGRIQNTQVGASNPLAGQCLPGCASFETPAFAEPYRIAGLPTLSLTVTPTGPGGGLSVFLYRVSETGTTSRVGWGQVNLGFSEPGVPRAVTPGQEMRVEFDLQPLDAVVPAGSKLRLVVGQGSAWNRLPTIPNYPIQLHVGAGRSSFEVFNVEPKAKDFFTPPAAP